MNPARISHRVTTATAQCGLATRPCEKSGLAPLLRHPNLWRGRDHDLHSTAGNTPPALPSGHQPLDRQLPGGGWPRGALTEILHAAPGQGELRLLLPALRQLTTNGETVALIDPPWHPFGPALTAAGIAPERLLIIGPLPATDRPWALEQTLRSGHCPAVLAWPDDNLPIKTLRRLQLAAEAGQASAFLFRDSRLQPQHSPAALRLRLDPPDRLQVLKCRGRHITRPIELPALDPDTWLPLPACQYGDTNHIEPHRQG